MRVTKLGNAGIKDFIVYSRIHRSEHDDSFLGDEELDKFDILENPTVILEDDFGSIIGAASLMMMKINKINRKSRFRILHSTIQSIDAYRMMMDEILKEIEDIDSVYLFLPKRKDETGRIIQQLGFEIERSNMVLKRDNNTIELPQLTKGFSIKPFRERIDEGVWCNIRNAAFAHLKGQMAQTPDMIKVDRESDEYVENGMMILWNEENPVGVISMIKTEENGEYMAWIGPVAVLPEYQGKGLGRILLRAGVRHAADSGLNSSVLVVDAENTRAVNLYMGEGFYEIDASVCYSKKL